MFEYINAQYRIGADEGRTAEAVSDYYVRHGIWTTAQCVATWSKLDFGEARREYIPIERTITAIPSWRPLVGGRPVLPTRGGRPVGQVYALTVRSTHSAPNGPTTTANLLVHVTIVPGGGTYEFVRCALSNSE